MAVVCAKCGAQVAEGAQFCAACGTAVSAAPSGGSAAAGSGFTPVNIPGQAIPGQAAAAAPPPPAAGTPPLPGYTQVNAGAPPSGGYAPPAGYVAPSGYVAPGAAPVRSGGSSAVKIILIVVVVIVGLGILGASVVGFMVWRVAHAIHENAKTGQITLSTPGGTMTAGSTKSPSADELGTDIYPGAQAEQGGMHMELPTGSIVSGAFETSDPKDAVLNFYKGKFGSDASVFDSANGAMISLKKGEHETVVVTISAESDGKTKIAIVHTKNKGQS